MGSNKGYTTCKKVFRVWINECLRGTKELLKGYMLYDGIQQYIGLTDEVFSGNSILMIETMQWIGKTDIHGKKIFENDIIKFKDPSYWEHIAYGQVVYNHDNCQFEVRNLKRSTYYDKSFSYQEHEFCRMHEIEIIGNSYENPNMLIEYDEIPKEKVKK